VCTRSRSADVSITIENPTSGFIENWEKEMLFMCYIKRFFGFGSLFFLVAIFPGCATVPNPKPDYYPNLPTNIKTIEEAISDLAVLFRENKLFYNTQNSDDTGICNSITKESFSGYDVSEVGRWEKGGCFYYANSIDVAFDRIDFPLFPLFYQDLKGFKIIASQGYMVELPKGRTINFRIAEDEAAAHRMADDLFFIQQNLGNLDKYDEDKLAAFKETADQYRALKVKPPVSEEQRKFIVQASAFTEQKDYTRAIDRFKKAIEIDPTSYPAAYYNMALLYAQERRFKLAIECMNKYLLLEPEAKDARSAQDKIYEWEGMLEK
jgi:tetratricopeptide (TPR) repeat protein